MTELTAHAEPCTVEIDAVGHFLDSRQRIIITIDGPAGTGKSSVARDLAHRLSLDFLDTGAMYRAATALAIDLGVDLSDEDAVADTVRSADLRFEWTTDPPTLYAFGRPIMHRLRQPDVSARVSPVSSLAAVRKVLVERQRRIGEVHQRLVSEGRDQGSVVFYDADVKFYLDASPRVRAARRAEQLRRMGQPADLDAIEREITDRDRRDSTRAVGPLTCPDDAVRVDTSDLDQAGVVESLVRLVMARV
ncbi:MAG: (d)CMP kinase [Phycisphaerae bacterium]|nr:(d)CMP kinase [Phycisphaerae bacterium]